MKKLVSVVLGLGVMVSVATASAMPSKEASARIKRAVDGIKPIAQSGVEVFKVKPGTVKEMLFAVGVKDGIVESKNDFNWVGSSDSAWEGDSLNWGTTTMKGAYNYLFKNDNVEDGLKQDDEDGKDTKEYMAKVKAAKEAFKLFLGTGVEFGVTPLGAVQCGFRYAGLAVIDMNSGTVYIFSIEGSGC